MSVTWKPVACTITSHSCSAPSFVTMPSGLISAIPSVTTFTFGLTSAGYQLFDGRIRLQPTR